MEQVEIISTSAILTPRLRINLTYFSILLFLFFVVFASFSVKNFVKKSLSITLVEPEIVVPIEELDTNIIEENSTIIVTIEKGDTLHNILLQQKIPSNDISQIIQIADTQNIVPSLKIGQQITFEYETKLLEKDNEDLTWQSKNLIKMIISIDKLNSLEIIREGNNFIFKNKIIPLKKRLIKTSAIINTNFISALKSLGLSANNIIDLIHSYSYEIDFQRQLQPGDTISVITEKFISEDGKFSHFGRILNASLNLSGKEYNIYRYSPDDSKNNHSFFSEKGKSVKRNLLRTPVNLIRISSNYGNRIHPTLGYTKMHKGVDFAAPEGTPIYAAGDGVITEIGFRSGYGKIVQIKHSPTLTTAYAHASRFARNLKLGDRVKQGQVIAYVGKTGRTTGAHLHYEVKVDGKHINPMSIKTTPGIELTGAQLVKFQQFKDKIKELHLHLEKHYEIAENEFLLN